MMFDGTLLLLLQPTERFHSLAFNQIDNISLLDAMSRNIANAQGIRMASLKGSYLNNQEYCTTFGLYGAIYCAK